MYIWEKNYGLLYAQLKDTIERVKAVDRAASIVDGILKQGQHATLNTGLVSSP